MKKNKIIHVLIGLDVGGAETMLKRLVLGSLDDAEFEHIVISLTDVGIIGEEIVRHGGSVYALGLKSFIDLPRAFFSLSKLFKKLNPDVVHAWMYHAAILSGVVGKILSVPVIVWGIRNCEIPQKGFSVSVFLVKLCSFFSGTIPNCIAYCADSARVHHESFGYSASNSVVINNGYSLDLLKSDDQVRKSIRSRYNFKDSDIVIGIVGRYCLLKDYKTFICAASQILAHVENVKILMVGRGIDQFNAEIGELLEMTGQKNRYVLAGEQRNAVEYYSAMDIFCLSSISEGFPNVVCEAMAMELPCVVTDVGDCRRIVESTGIVVPPASIEDLTIGLMKFVSMDVNARKEIGKRSRHLIESRYSLAVILDQYRLLYSDLLSS